MTTYYSINLDWNELNHVIEMFNHQKLKLSYHCSNLQAGEYKLGSITVRAQLLRDHLRVEVSADDHDNDLWSRISLESFPPLKPFAYAPPQESFYWIDDGAMARDSMKPPKGVERAPPEATWGAQGHLVWEDGQGQQAQSKVQHQHDKVFAQHRDILLRNQVQHRHY